MTLLAAAAMDPHPDQALPVGVARLAVTRWQGAVATNCDDLLAQEVPVALVFNGISHAVMMASPVDLDDFALGFALTEGLIDSPAELYGCESHEVAQGIELQLQVSSACEWRLKARRRTLAGRTGCGLCGTDSLSQVRRHLNSAPTVPVDVSAIWRAEAALQRGQVLQRLTGATHAAAWVNAAGEIAHLREDVGRHNALDKLIGCLVRQQVHPASGFVCITSRASFEMVQKTLVFGAGVLAAVSAPTALAVELARDHNLALAGYVRGQGVPPSLVVYSFPERFGATQPDASPVTAFSGV